MPSDAGSPSRHSGRRSLGFLVTGTIFAQGIQFAASLVLTRLYSPAEFGQYASVLAIASVLGAVITLSYQTAIPLAENDEESRAVAWLSVAAAAALASLITVFLAGAVVAGVEILGWRPDAQHVLFVPLTSLAIGVWGTLQLRQSRLSAFHRVALATSSGAATQVGTQIGLGWLGTGAPGLSAGYLLGRLVNAGMLLRGARLGRPPGLRRLRRTGARWSQMPRWLLPTTVLNLLGTSAITPWVAHNYGLATAGSFAFAFQMLSVPAALVGQAVATILFPRFAEGERVGGVTPSSLDRQVVGLASVAAPVFLPVLILGPQVFSFVFGQAWTQAGQIAAILAPWLAVSFVSSPLSSLAVVKGRLRLVAVIGVVETAARFGAIALGGAVDSAAIGIGLYSLVGFAISVNYVAWTLRLAGGSLRKLVVRHWWWCSLLVGVSALLMHCKDVLPVAVVGCLTALACAGLGLLSLRAISAPAV